MNTTTIDLDRLEAIADTLEGNFQYSSADQIRELIQLARRSQPVEAAGIKTWQERVDLSEYAQEDRCSTALVCAEAEIADLRAALAAREGQQEPVARVSPAELRDIQSGLMAVPVRSNNWRDDQTIPLYLAVPVAQQSEAGAQAVGDALLKSWPDRIWLQAGDTNEREEYETLRQLGDGITWADSAIDRFDVEYVRADLIERAVAQPTEAGAPTAAAELSSAEKKMMGVIRRNGSAIPASKEAWNICKELQRKGLLDRDTTAGNLTYVLAAPTPGRESAAPAAPAELIEYLMENFSIGHYHAESHAAIIARKLASHPAREGVGEQDALEQLIAQHRIAITPEYEGGFRAQVYRDEEAPQASGYGSTPRAAVDAAMQKGAQQDV